MELAEIMDKMRALESELELATNELKGKLIDAVDRLPDGVRYLNDGSNGGPVIVLTRFSKSNWSNWSPEYYIPKAQQRAIVRALKNCNTLEKICKAIYDMLKRGYVAMSNDPSDKIYLNKHTLDIIKESDLGKYALSHPPKVDKKPGVCRYCGHRVPDTGYVIYNDDIFCDDDCCNAWDKEKGIGNTAQF